MEELGVNLAVNWKYYMVGLFVVEKIVKLTPWKWDDVVIDMIFKGIIVPAGRKLIGK